MTIKELKKQLENLPEDMDIIISGDPEGNDFRTIDEVAFIEDEKGQAHYIIYPTDDLIEIYNW
jgi:hypothetical protein